jgi:hypothetical protein
VRLDLMLFVIVIGSDLGNSRRSLDRRMVGGQFEGKLRMTIRKGEQP